MAKTTADTSAHSQGEDSVTTFQAEPGGRIELPSPDFIAGATMTRHGNDLILQAPDGGQATIEGYFSAEPPPLLTAADGSALTPALVHSFAKSALEYASNETANDESPVGAVEEVQGKATVTRADGVVEDIVIGTPIYQGDIIQTDAGGAVNIVFIDETSMAVSQNARLAVDQYTFDPSTESGTTNFSVLRGLFVFTSGLIGRDDPDDVKIETPVGSIGIRGTIIAGEIVPGGESNISVLEGAIVITNGTGNITLSEQFETIRVAGYDAPMQNLGVIPANDLGTKFSSIGTVLPSLFTTINDSSLQQQHNTQPGAQQQPAQAESPAHNAAPETSGDTSPAAPQAAPPLSFDMPGNGLPSAQTALGQAPSTNPSQMAGDNGLSNITPSSGVAPPPATSPPLNNQPSTTQTAPSILPEPQPLPLAPNTSGGNTVATPPAIARLINLDQPTTHIDIISDGMSNMAGYSISALGDLNRDGFADFIFSNDSGSQNLRYIGMGGASGIGSGNIPSLSRINVSQNPTGTDFFGAEVSGIGDFNGDGTVDYVIGQSNRDTGYVDSGATFIFSGANASHFSFYGGAAAAHLGVQVAGIGDYNNDGYADVIVGTNMEHAVYIGGTGGTPLQSVINGDPSTGFAASLIGIGDYNGDGFADFAIGAPADMSGRGAIHIYTGNADGILNVTATLVGDTGQNIGTQLASIGDVNGDGRSDFLAAGSDNTGRLYFGAGGGVSISAGGYDIIGGGGVGDFNGDGYDDFAISLANDSGSRTFVVLGKSSFSGEIDLTYLTNRDNAFEFTYSGMNNTATPDIEGVGDVNGDGYDDFAMGVPDINGSAAGNGGMFLVYGRSSGNISSSNAANADGQHLVAASARQNLSDGGFEDVSMRGTAAANNFEIHNTNFLGIHGGGNGSGGMDTIRAVGNLDFGNVDFESISGIERLMFTGNNQVITLSVENIFNLLKSSSGYTDGTFTSNGFFRIDGGGVTGATLILDAANESGDGTNANIVSALNEMGTGATAESNMGSYRHFSIGGYDLLIDSNVTVDVA